MTDMQQPHCTCPDCPSAAIARQLAEENARLRLLAGQDELTGLLNRRGMRALWSTWANAGIATIRRSVAGLAMIDLDLFKGVNDRYGHDAGDRVLCHLAAAMKETGGTGIRLGGDEFAILLAPGDDPFVAVKTMAEAAAQPVAITPGVQIKITLSVGVVALDEAVEAANSRGQAPVTWLGTMLSMADVRVYVAKDSGRACVVGPVL